MPSRCAVNALGWEPGNIHFCLSSILSLFMTWGKLFHLSGSQIYHLLIAKFLFNYKMLYRHLYFRQCGAWKIQVLCTSAHLPQSKTRQKQWVCDDIPLLAADKSHEIIWPMNKIRRFSNDMFETSTIFIVNF